MPIREGQDLNSSEEEIKETIGNVHEKAKLILSNTATAPIHHKSVISQGDEPPAVQTSYLTGATGFQNTLINHHMQSLIQAGLVKKVEKLPSTDPRSHPGSLGENVYQCTERGIKAAKILDGHPVGGSLDVVRAELERQKEELAWTKRMMMKMAVSTDTLTLEQAREMMPSDEFEKAFEE